MSRGLALVLGVLALAPAAGAWHHQRCDLFRQSLSSPRVGPVPGGGPVQVEVHAVAVSDDGRWTAAVLDRGVVQIGDRARTSHIEIPDPRVSTLRWEPGAAGLVLVTPTGTARWSRVTRKLAWKPNGSRHEWPDRVVACSRDGRWSALERERTQFLMVTEPYLELWEAGATQLTHRIRSGLSRAWRTPRRLVQAVNRVRESFADECGLGPGALLLHGADFSPDGTRLATAFEDRLRIWSVPDGERIGSAEVATEYPKEPALAAFEFSPDGSRLAAAIGSTIRLLDGRTGRDRGELASALKHIRALAYRPDGAELAVMEHDVFELWDLASGRRKRTVRDAGDGRTMAYSPDGRHLATAGPDGLRVWECGSGRLVVTVPVIHAVRAGDRR
jgi:WD40 repeat protein